MAKVLKLPWVIALSFLFFSVMAFSRPLNRVKLGLTEALSQTDSTSSERYRSKLEAAFYYAIGKNEARLNRCGYEFETIPVYFESKNKLGAKTSVEDLQGQGAWATFGPRRSDDFLAGAGALQGMSFVSPMANSFAIEQLPPPAFTMYPTNREFAQDLIRALTKEQYQGNYGVVVDATCPSCRDFAEAFDDITSTRSTKFNKVFSLDVAGEEPDLAPLFTAMRANEIKFLFLPNNSALSGFIISKLQTEFPKIKYVGGHGWGDANYGFLFKYGINANIEGFCVRAGRDFEKMKVLSGVRSLDYVWQGSNITPNFTAFAAIKFVDIVTNDLCEWRPKSKAEFLLKLAKTSSDHFQMNEPISVYRLQESKLKYGYAIE